MCFLLILTDDIILEGGGGMSHVCVELRVLPHDTDTRATTYRDGTDTPKVVQVQVDISCTSNVNLKYIWRFISQESCAICSKSTPDVSARPIKSCLKKRASQLSCSSSLPSIHRECSAEHNHSHTQLVNTHSRDITSHSTYTHTDKVLHKISHDLDFLLDRTPSRAADHCSQRVQEAPP